MGLNAVKMLGISITNSSKKEILEYVRKGLGYRGLGKGKTNKTLQKPIIIVTPNPEQIVLAQKHTHFRQILNQADIKLPDGIGVVWASRFFTPTRRHADTPTLARAIPGVELMEDLVAMAAKEGHPIALIGGRAGVAVEALECLQQKHPGLTGWALEPGEIHVSDLRNLRDLGKIAERIKTTGTRLVFVGLGAPKQELLIEQLAQKTGDRVVLMAVGGSFDIIAGRIKRAPVILRGLGLEWFWRLLQEPWRIRRQLALLRFIFLVLRVKLRV